MMLRLHEHVEEVLAALQDSGDLDLDIEDDEEELEIRDIEKDLEDAKDILRQAYAVPSCAAAAFRFPSPSLDRSRLEPLFRSSAGTPALRLKTCTFSVLCRMRAADRFAVQEQSWHGLSAGPTRVPCEICSLCLKVESSLMRYDAMVTLATCRKIPLGRVLDVGVGALISLNTLVSYSAVMRCRPSLLLWFRAAGSERS